MPRTTLDGATILDVPVELALCTYGVFTTFVVSDLAVLGLQQHLDRLDAGVQEMWGAQLSRGEVLRCLDAHLQRSRAPARVRVTIYPRRFDMGSPRDAHGHRILVTSSAATPDYRAEEVFSVAPVEFVRWLPKVKSVDVSSQLRLRREAQLAGHDDAVLVDGGTVLEGTTWSVLVWQGDSVVTPGGPVLESVTTNHLMAMARAWGLRTHQRSVALDELHRADLVLAVNVSHPARAISRLGDRDLRVDPGLLLRLASGYSALPRDRILI